MEEGRREKAGIGENEVRGRERRRDRENRRKGGKGEWRTEGRKGGKG